MTAPTVEVERDPARALIDQNLYEQLVQRIAYEHDLPRSTAEKAMDEALCFLRDCALQPDERLRPSKVADIGWHTFILFTREYAEFCDRVAGHFIHHVPEPGAGVGQCTQCHQGCHDSP